MPTPVDPVTVPSALSAALGRLSAGLTFAAALPDLEAALDARGAAVVEAPPGTGKTTVVPPALAVRLADHGGGRVLVTQPRRVAVRAAWRRLRTASLRRRRRLRCSPGQNRCRCNGSVADCLVRRWAV